MPTIALQPATAPVDAQFPPASAQAMLNFIAAYLGVSGLETLTGINIGTATPAASDRDKGWIKLDPVSKRALGLFVYSSGEWVAIPVIASTGESTPQNPTKGELFYSTVTSSLSIYTGTAWTSNLNPTGTTAKRPTGVPVNYLYFDTDIGHLLRYTSNGWTTLEGSIGDVKFVDLQDEQDALDKNPGWALYTVMKGRFPIAWNDEYGPTAEGSAVQVAKPADNATDSETIKPFKALIFLRKDF
jgi:hypothetical protein